MNSLGICCVVKLLNGGGVAVNYGFVIGSSSSFGLMKNALNAKQMNTIPPTMVTVFKTREIIFLFLNYFASINLILIKKIFSNEK